MQRSPRNGMKGEAMYRIGIINDIKGECADIQVAVLKNAGFDVEIEFKEYELGTRT